MRALETLLKHMDDDRSRDSIIKAMHDYARLQIEKDRERVKDAIWLKADIDNPINEVIDSVEINLD